MYRPFMFIGIGAFIASFAVLKSIWLAVLVLCLMSGLAVIFTKTKQNYIGKGVIIALIFIMLTLRFVSLSCFIDAKNEKLVGTSAEITGEITEIFTYDNFSRLTLKVRNSSQKAAEGLKLSVTLKHTTEALPGDTIKATVTFNALKDNYKVYNFGKGIYFSGEIQEIYSYQRDGFSFYRIIYNVRSAILKSIDNAGADECGAVLKALIIGDDSQISTEFNREVRSAGVSHMLVVSGMHLGILCTVLMNIINGKTKRWVAVTFGIVMSLFILAVCLFHVSILRASIAYIIMLLAKLFKRNFDPLNALGFGAAVAVFFMPYIFYNVAFLLSIAATYAVLYPARLLIKAVGFERFGYLGKVFRYAYDILIITVATLFCTLPIVAYYFGYVALAAPITNLAVTLAMNTALIVGVLAVMVSFLPFGSFLSIPFYLISRLCVKYFIFAVEQIGKNDFGVVFINGDENIYCFLITIAFILLVKIFTKPLILKREEKLRAQRQNT